MGIAVIGRLYWMMISVSMALPRIVGFLRMNRNCIWMKSRYGRRRRRRNRRGLK